MQRREVITFLGGAAVASSTLWPLVAHAQQAGKVVRIGFLGANLNNPPQAVNYQAFLAQLRELGFSEGQNLIVDYRDFDRSAWTVRRGGRIDAVAA